VVLSPDGQALYLDKRALRVRRGPQGVIVTDPIHVGLGSEAVALQTRIPRLAVRLSADVPEGASVKLELRSGANPLDTADWRPWEGIEGLDGEIRNLAGQYVQARITLRARSPELLPSLLGLELKAVQESHRMWHGKLSLVKADVRKIVRSPIDFKYERPDHPTLVRFRKASRLDEVVAGGKDDFEKMVKLMDWVGSCRNVRGTRRERVNGAYAWDIDKVFAVTKEGPTVYGHCMSYAEVMITALCALGYVGARHMADVGFRDMSHEIVDAWVPSLGKWVHFDPSLAMYYYDKKTKVPLNMIEMHKVVVDKFLREGEDVNWLRPRREGPSYQRVRQVGGRKHIGAYTGGWRYGERMKPNYDWGWSHGYLAAGFVQMTPRNDFHSHPEAASKRFEHYPGYDNYPYWVDAKTPPRRGVTNWYTRMRDFYWTLDQAAFRLIADEKVEGLVHVLLGQSMPFFDHYRVTIDGGKPQKSRATDFAWRLKPGENRLSVVPVDKYGKTGLGSSIAIRYAR
jgi:hypothetical protein